MLDEQDARELADEITGRIAERVADWRARTERARADRAAKTTRRAAGLRARHRRKLDRTPGDQQ